MRFVTAVLCFVLSAAALHAASLPDDPLLDKPVTLAVKGEALTDVVKMLRQQTGAHLRASSEVADRKATLFIDKKPLRQVMDGIVLVLGYDWSVKELDGENYYTLFEDSRTARKRDEAWQAAFKSAWAALEDHLRRASRLLAKNDKELMVYEKELKASLKKQPDKETSSQLKAVQILLQNPTTVMPRQYLELYRSLPEHARKALFDGREVYLDSRSPEPEWTAPKSLIDSSIFQSLSSYLSNSGRPTTFPELTDVNIRFYTTASHKHITFYVCNAGRNAEGNSTTSHDTVIVREKVSDYLPEKVSIPLPQKTEGTVLTEKVTITQEELDAELGMPVSRQPTNRSDVLALLHKKTGLQIISDHYSNWRAPVPYQKTPLKDILDNLEEKQSSSAPRPGWMYDMSDELYTDWGWDGTFAYFRTMDSAYWDKREIPNRLLRPWQTIFRDNRYLDLDQLADMSMLSDDQIDSLERNCWPLRLGHVYIKSNKPVLRVWGMLSLEQRQQAFQEGVGLTPEMRNAVAELWHEQSTMHVQKSQVGIYKNGRRVDRHLPEPESKAEPVAVVARMQELKAGFSSKNLKESEGGDKAKRMQEPLEVHYEIYTRLADGTRSQGRAISVRIPPKPDKE